MGSHLFLLCGIYTCLFSATLSARFLTLFNLFAKDNYDFQTKYHKYLLACVSKQHHFCGRQSLNTWSTWSCCLH